MAATEYGDIDITGWRESLGELYGSDAPRQTARYQALLAGFARRFESGEQPALFSVPGRTEVGGNHTDHNAGRVLAAAINLDIAAVAAPNRAGVVRIRSTGYPDIEISIDETAPVESERYGSAALARGVCARMRELGLGTGGFDACVSGDVPKGSGLSSSAAFEVLVATIINRLYSSGDADPITIARIAQYAENRYFGKPCGLMDQTACAVGGFVFIDFQNLEDPLVRQVAFDLGKSGYECVITDTGGSHADLNGDYAALEHEMKEVARHFGRQVLREIDRGTVTDNIAALRKSVGDRGILRALHFFDDDARVVQQVDALERRDLNRFLRLVIESGRGSWTMCQNYYSCLDVRAQGISIACAMSEKLLQGTGAWRVHGGGFAGTIQAFVPVALVESYKEAMERVFGQGSCHRLRIRTQGAVALAHSGS